MEIKGKLVEVTAEELGTTKDGKNWKRTSIILEYGEQYPKKACIQLNEKMIEKFEAINANLGQEMTIKVNVDSREHNGKWYTNIIAWSL